MKELASYDPVLPCMLPKPQAGSVAETLLKQQDPANWSEEIWAAYRADMCELRNHCGKYCAEVHPDGPYYRERFHERQEHRPS